MTLPAALDVVVFELPAEHRSEAQAAIDSCQLVLGPGKCRASADAGPDANWHATIVWQDAANLDASVELREEASGPLLSVREVRFEQQDSLEQRYRALGLLIVSHVVASQPAPEPRPPPVPAPLPAPVPTPLSRVNPRPWGMDFTLALGSALSSEQLAWGGSVRGWFGVAGDTFRPQLALGWMGASGQPEVDFYVGSVGVAVPFAASTMPLSAELHVEAMLQRLELVAEAAGEREDYGVTLGGVGFGADGFLDLGEHWALVLGVKASLPARRLSVDVASESQGELGFPSWKAHTGLRLMP